MQYNVLNIFRKTKRVVVLSKEIETEMEQMDLDFI